MRSISDPTLFIGGISPSTASGLGWTEQNSALAIFSWTGPKQMAYILLLQEIADRSLVPSVRPDAMMGPDCRRAVHVREQLIARLWIKLQYYKFNQTVYCNSLQKWGQTSFSAHLYFLLKFSIISLSVCDMVPSVEAIFSSVSAIRFWLCSTVRSGVVVFLFVSHLRSDHFFFTSSIVRPSPDTASTA